MFRFPVANDIETTTDEAAMFNANWAMVVVAFTVGLAFPGFVIVKSETI